LLGFAALFVVLFLVFAIAEGIGDPSVPSDAVAVVEDAPGDLGTVTKEEFDRALEQAAAQAKKPVPKPGDEKYDELMETALGEKLDAIWIQGQADEIGISVTPEEVATELKKLKGQAFKTEKQYEEFLKEAKYTQADVTERVKIQMLSEQIQNQISEEAPIPNKNEIEDFYEAAKATQYTTPESRDIRVVINEDRSKVDAALAALEKDDSIASWTKVTKKYSTDPRTKQNGGLQAAVTEGTLGEPLNAAVFEAQQGELEGPLKERKTFIVFEVMKVTPEKVQSLDEVKSQISGQLAEQSKQQAFSAFVRNYGISWRTRTTCASGYVIERCGNFESDGRPSEANNACYEANPKKPAEACPAPIQQVKPAQPGTVTPLNKEGQKLSQRPRPAGLTEAPEAGAPEGEVPTGLPSEPAEAGAGGESGK
jgi:parvulin-like peptidyl-prolyl isomerase